MNWPGYPVFVGNIFGAPLPLGDGVRHHGLRSWPVMLFLLLIWVSSIALLVVGPSPSGSTFDHVAWIYAAYFAIAWLLPGVIIRPDHVSRPMLVLVTATALATQVPLAVTLEADLHANTAGPGPSIYSVALPEELAKAIPVLAVALIYPDTRHGVPLRLTGTHYDQQSAIRTLTAAPDLTLLTGLVMWTACLLGEHGLRGGIWDHVGGSWRGEHS